MAEEQKLVLTVIPVDVLEAIEVLVIESDSAIDWEWIGYGKFVPQVALIRDWLRRVKGEG